MSEPWDWLGEALAADFANTLHRRGFEYVDELRSGADLAEWARREDGRVPAVDAADADARLDEVRALRDEVFALLGAAAAGDRLPPTPRLNAALRAFPLVPQLEPGGARLAGVAPAAPLEELLARVAASAVELATAEAGSLALCDAPGCGGFFLRHRRDQRWCGPACGTRARVARHAARRRAGG
jgi:predicted RNA-binding Zn ribbon-like protein